MLRFFGNGRWNESSSAVRAIAATVKPMAKAPRSGDGPVHGSARFDAEITEALSKFL